MIGLPLTIRLVSVGWQIKTRRREGFVKKMCSFKKTILTIQSLRLLSAKWGEFSSIEVVYGLLALR